MRSSTAPKPTRLLSPWALLLLAVVVGVLLYLTHRSEELLLPSGKQPDAVGVSYAELLLQSHPDDDALRMTLIEQLISLDDYARARHHLQALKRPDQDQDKVRFYQVEVDVLQALSASQGLAEAERLALIARLARVPREGLSPPLLERHARHALALNAPVLAGEAFLALAQRDAENAQAWLGEAAKWLLAGGQAERAARLHIQLLEQAADPAQRLQWFAQAFASLRAAGREEAAAELAAAHLELLQKADPQLLQGTVQAALGSRRFDLARRLLSRWRIWDPESPQALAQDFSLSLAAGDLQRAWALGGLLLQQRPDDPDLLRQMAQLGEWTHDHRAALGYWLRLLERQEDLAVREHAWRLAAQLFDFDQVIPLLQTLGQQRRLSDGELEALVYSHNSRGTPEQLERWLRGYLTHHPQHRQAWQSLLQVLEQTHQYQAVTEVWARLERRFGLSIAQRLAWAEAHWQLFDLPASWRVLLAIDDADIRDPAYWRMRAAVAWELEKDAQASRALERLQALAGPLGRSEEIRLLNLYRQHAPAKALRLLIDSWRRSRHPNRLSEALLLAEQLSRWSTLQQLIDEALRLPQQAQPAALWSARALLAERAARPDEAERLYRQGLARFPQQSGLRERLLWLLIEQNRRRELAALLHHWRGRAQQNGGLWLPFASANLLLNRTPEALVWLRKYLQANPRDWLVRAAYADALEAGGYDEAARRLRRKLLASIEPGQADLAGERYRVYLRLLASQSERHAQAQLGRWQDGSQAMLQLWFERFIGSLDRAKQEALKDDWLAWGARRGLRSERYEHLQQALRHHDREALSRLLAGGTLDPAQRVEVLTRLGQPAAALGEGLANLADSQPGQIREQLRRQTLELHQRLPQGLQLGWQDRDFGTLTAAGASARIARSLGEDWHADLNLSQVDYAAASLDDRLLGNEHNARLGLQRERADGALGLVLDGSWRADEDRLGFGLWRRLQLSSRDSLRLELDWQRETDESGLLRVLGMRDGLRLAGQHQLDPRDQASWSLAHQRYRTRQGDALGQGQQLNLELSHALFFEGPTWLLRSGLSYQRNSLASGLPEGLTAPAGPLRLDAATPASLLQERFGQLYLGSTWRRGLPAALNPERGNYSWSLDLLSGWQWTERSFNYAINTGIGLELLGDDELAFTLGYQSAPPTADGQPGGTLGLTYSTRFGR